MACVGLGMWNSVRSDVNLPAKLHSKEWGQHRWTRTSNFHKVWHFTKADRAMQRGVFYGELIFYVLVRAADNQHANKSKTVCVDAEPGGRPPRVAPWLFLTFKWALLGRCIRGDAWPCLHHKRVCEACWRDAIMLLCWRFITWARGRTTIWGQVRKESWPLAQSAVSGNQRTCGVFDFWNKM